MSWAARRAIDGQVDVAPGARVVVAHARGEQVQRADHRGQHVVEVVGDAAGELAHRFHLLALAQRFLDPQALGHFLGHAALEPLVELLQLGLGGLALGDVDGHADHAHAGAGLEQAAALGRDPAHDAVLLADSAVLHVVERALQRIDGRGEGGAGGVAVVRVQALVEVAQRHRHVRGDAEHGLGPRRPDQQVVDQVHVPEAHVAGVGGQAQALLALGQRGLGLLALGQVEHRADHAHRPALAVAQHGAAVEHGGVAAVGAAEAVFAVPGGGAAAFDHRVDVGVHARAVVRMDVVQPPLRAGLGQGVAEQDRQRLVPDHVAIGDAPVPDRVVRRARGQLVAFLGLAVALLGGLALGDVQRGADQADHGAVGVAQRRLGRQPGRAAAIGEAHFLLQRLGLAAGHHPRVGDHDRGRLRRIGEQLGVGAADIGFRRPADQLGGAAVADQQPALAVLGVDHAGHRLDERAQQGLGLVALGFEPAPSSMSSSTPGNATARPSASRSTRPIASSQR